MTDLGRRPLSGALVEMLEGAQAGTSVVTGNDGMFKLTGVPPLAGKLHVTREGFESIDEFYSRYFGGELYVEMTSVARIIAIGDVVASLVRSTDPSCRTIDLNGGTAPCQRFTLSNPAPGTLTATVTSADTAGMILTLIKSGGDASYSAGIFCCASPLVGRLVLSPGSNATIQVSLKSATATESSQSFQLAMAVQ